MEYHDKHDKHHDKCCDPCDKRMQGEQGPQGVQGPRGQDGLQGPQGVAGPQGMPGTCVNCWGEHPHCKCPEPEFAEVYSQVAQDLAASPGPNLPGQMVLFESTIYATANIDLSMAAVNGQVKVLRAGWYKAGYSICGSLNPLPTPLPIWAISLFKNGNLVPGSSFSNITLSPDEIANELFGEVLLHLDVGDLVNVANSSTNNLILNANTLGVSVQPNSAHFMLFLLKAD